jgi:branched-chain amino acid transport system ATP-binding protein
VEQDTALALEVGQRVYVLDSGRVVREGTPDIIAQDPMIREVYLGIT